MGVGAGPLRCLALAQDVQRGDAIATVEVPHRGDGSGASAMQTADDRVGPVAELLGHLENAFPRLDADRAFS